MKILLLLATIYLISVLLMWLHTHISHSKKGIFSNTDLEKSDLIVTIVPILNTALIFTAWLAFWPYKKTHKKHSYKWLRKFFAIRN